MIPIHFILSAPRSGSTWLARSLNAHPEIFATEHRLFGKFCEIWANNDGGSAPRITFDAYAEAFAMHYMFGEMDLQRNEFIEVFQRSFVNFLTSFAARRTNKKVVVDKVTPYLGTCQTVIDQMSRILPEAKVILLMRDGRDVLTSGTFDWLPRESKDSPRYQFFVEQNRAKPLDRFFDDKVIHDWAHHWLEVAECSKTISLAGTVTYEKMKSSHAGELGRIFQWIGVNADSELAIQCAESTTFEKTTGRKPGEQQHSSKARKGIAGDWKNYFTRADGELFHSIAGEQLIQFGYESDDKWLNELPEKLNWTSELLR